MRTIHNNIIIESKEGNGSDEVGREFRERAEGKEGIGEMGRKYSIY